MIALEEAVARIQQRCRRLDEERCELAAAAGRVLAEAVYSEEDQPPFDRSAMDGFAVRAGPIEDRYAIASVIHAGDPAASALEPGTCARVFTGAPIPAGADRVIMQELTESDGSQMRVVGELSGARHIRHQGEDVQAGQQVLPPGCRLGPAQLGIAASVGATELMVVRKPRVAIICTGDELVPPDLVPDAHQIRSVNGTLLSSFVGGFGGQVIVSLLLPDDPEELGDAFEDARQAECDLVLVSGGSSVGEKDFTRQILEQAGLEIHIEQVNVRPGKPLLFGSDGRLAAFGLPGNPVSHVVCALLFVRTAVERMLGLEGGPPFLAGELESEFSYAPHPRETLWPGRWRLEGSAVRIAPLPWNNSGHLASLAAANALIRVPAESGPFAAGTALMWLPLDAVVR